MNLEQIATALGDSKKVPDGYLCKCPCHADGSASLSLKLSEKGNLVFNCFAGCKWEDIKNELISRGLIRKKEESPKKDKYAGAKFYIYKDAVGNILSRKVKLPDKTMWSERLEGSTWKSGLNGMVTPLYNLQQVIASDLIYLCEGEKDAETLISHNLTATTNNNGATSWAKHWTDQLKNKTVIIIPDNDEAGKKRVQILTKALHGVVKELRVFMPDGVPEKGDITDWVNAGGDPATILQKSVAIEQKKTPKKATHDEYYTLFETELNNPRACIFNEKLMYQDSTGIWNPAVNALDRLKAAALIANESREAKFSISHILPFFFSYEATKPREFLVEIPEWDGTDRIEQMAKLIKLKEKSEVNLTSFTELLKEWCGIVFQRLQNPMIQNRILVLQGDQGIGKDTWIDLLVGGLGQFAITFSIVKEDKDTYLNLHRGLIMKISEFDKTARADVSTLKDIITTPSTNLRASYDRDAKLRFSRCSFITSVNPENILRDSTGNRRFLIFEIESIQYPYANWSLEKIKSWQMQCLAQMVVLANDKYKASKHSWLQMQEYIEKKTPGDLSDDVTETFISRIRSQNPMLGNGVIELSPTDERIGSVIEKLSRETGVRYKNLKIMIQNKIGIRKRQKEKRYWVWRIPETDVIADNIEAMNRFEEKYFSQEEMF